MKRRDSGAALVIGLIITAIIAAVVVGFINQLTTEQKISGNDLDSSSAFYAAEAGLEKLNADLSKAFQRSIFPSAAQLAALLDAANQPHLPGVTYSTYQLVGGQSTFLNGAINNAVQTITVTSTAGWPATGYFMIDGEVITYTATTGTAFTGCIRGTSGTAAAAHANNAVVSRSRIVTIAQGPNAGLAAQVIPFDITVVARAGAGAETRLTRQVQVALVPVFQFGVFSDTDLGFHSGPSFDFGGRIHTNGYLFLAQGNAATLTLSQKVTSAREIIRTHMANGQSVATSYAGTVNVVTTPGSFRSLAQNEGSITGFVGSPANAVWPGLSLSTYNKNILDGTTGGKPLTLPFAGGGAAPIEIIRRAPAGEDPTSILGQSRLYNQASIRVLLSDSTANLPGGTGYPLNAGLAAPPYNYVVSATRPPFAMSNPADADFLTATNADETVSSPLIDGFIRIDIQLANGGWQDVTMEILNLGIATGNPDAVLRFERLRPGAVAGSTTATDYYPLKLWDPREGEFRDANPGTGLMTKLGIFGLVELDVNNLRRWLSGTTGLNGGQALNNSGYIFYFSDRRGNRNAAGVETGEFGFEDIVNPSVAAGTPNNLLDAGEDFNSNGTLQTYGGDLPVAPFTIYPANTDLYSTRWTSGRAQKNKVRYFRRALKLTNGALGNLPMPGFTVAAENPVYVQGNYNANAAGFGTPNSAAAVIADAVTLLSNNWNDVNSFASPHNISTTSGRTATTTWYRVAVAGGKGRNFPQPGWTTSNYGSDGGVHNFLRFIERWTGITYNYVGSMVSLYYSHQATGSWACCVMKYAPPTRNSTFDTNFLVPSQLPPGTPRFRDINNLSFRQTLKATP